MDISEAKAKGFIKSGVVVAYCDAENFLDKWIEFFAGKYYHVGMLYVDEKTQDIYIYQAAFKNGMEFKKFDYTNIPFDLIDAGIKFDSDVKRYADSLLGRSYSWINFALVPVGFNSEKFGYICSTLVGTILTAADDKFDQRGLTPNQLVNDIMSKNGKRITVDKE